jgi:hypothetical protein
MQLDPVMPEKTEELKNRVEAKKHKLLAKYNELKADTRQEAGEARSRVKARLDQLEESVKTGWDNMSEAAKTKLNQLLNED